LYFRNAYHCNQYFQSWLCTSDSSKKENRIISNSIVTGETFEEAVGVDVQKFAVAFVEQLHGMREEKE